MTLFEKIKSMSIEELGDFLDMVVLDGRICGEAEDCDYCGVEECTLPSYKVRLTWDY